jgi:hypothetical protein
VFPIGCARQRQPPREIGLLLTLGALLASSPAAALSQDTDLPASAVYAAALDSLESLEPSSLLDTYVCERHWRNVYDLAIRCGQTGVARRSLRPVAEGLAVPLESDPQGCGAGAEGRSLQLSPVQFSSSSSAWFVAALVCEDPTGRSVELRVFGLHQQDAAWILDRVEVLPGTAS